MGDPNDNNQLSEINKKVALNYVQDSDFKKEITTSTEKVLITRCAMKGKKTQITANFVFMHKGAQQCLYKFLFKF